MRVLSVVGNRPQFIKSGPVSVALRDEGLEEVVLHTGQHYDRELSQVFFDELGLGPPAYRLDAGSGTHAEQTARMLPGIERAVLAEAPRWVLVYGDTNSTLAGALAVLPNVHYDNGSRSHFDSQAFYESGTPYDKFTPTGWLSRHMQADPANTSVMRAVSFGTTVPAGFRGTPTSLAVASLASLSVSGDATRDPAPNGAVGRGIPTAHQGAARASVRDRIRWGSRPRHPGIGRPGGADRV